jgi:hypothetical protein
MKEDRSKLDAALDSWRRTEQAPERLSSSGRTELFNKVSAPGSAVFGTATLFPPIRRWALAAGIPLVLTIGLAWVGARVGEPTPSGVRIEAAKQGEEVVFTIADGRRVHQVRKSESPTEFDQAATVRIRNGGSFRDGADTGGDLVFYRID